MVIWKTALASLFSILVLFLITRLGGRRQIKELSVFDYITGISIGSIAASASTAPLEEFPNYLVAMLIFGVFAVLLAVITNLSLSARHLLTGKPVILYQKGKFRKSKMTLMHVDMSELLMLCRNQGYFSMSAIDTVIMEANGKISILPCSSKKPVTPAEIKEPVPQEELESCVIIDGKIQEKVLSFLRYPKGKLLSELKKQNQELSSVLLATLTPSGKLSVFPCVDTPKGSTME